MIKYKYSCQRRKEGSKEERKGTGSRGDTCCAIVTYTELRAGLNLEAVLEDQASFEMLLKEKKELEAKLKTTST